ncbi:MAG: type II secretion system F family protein [bacterium]
MATFTYSGRNREGQIISGTMDGDNQNNVVMFLRAKGITPISIKQKSKDFNINFDFGKAIKTRDVAIFTRQFSTMISAGLPLVQCLTILSSQMDHPKFKKIIEQITQKVEGGATFAESLSKHPKVFDNLFVNMINAGEIGGVLDVVMNRLALYIENAERLQKKVKSALVYPVTVSIIALVIVSSLMLFIVPTFASMFSSFGGQLPAITQALLNTSNFMKKYFFLVFGFFFGVGFLLWRIKNTDKGRREVDKFVLKMPVFGILLRKVAVAKFTRTLGTLISSGVPIVESLNITAKTAGNTVVETAVNNARDSIQKGANIAVPLRDSGVFPAMVTQMISVGEETGALDQMLTKIADFYDEEVNTAVEGLTALIEPLLMVFLGTVIGVVVIALFLPIIKMSQLVG